MPPPEAVIQTLQVTEESVPNTGAVFIGSQVANVSGFAGQEAGWRDYAGTYVTRREAHFQRFIAEIKKSFVDTEI